MRSYRQWLVFSKALLALLLLAGITPAPFAAVNVDRTRLVFAANDVVQSLTLTNDSVTPMLLQVWTDAGETASSPDSSRTPLVVLPPVFKMQPDELRTLRVMLSSRRSLPGIGKAFSGLIFTRSPRAECNRQRHSQISVTPAITVKGIYSSARLKGPHQQR